MSAEIWVWPSIGRLGHEMAAQLRLVSGLAGISTKLSSCKTPLGYGVLMEVMERRKRIHETFRETRSIFELIRSSCLICDRQKSWPVLSLWSLPPSCCCSWPAVRPSSVRSWILAHSRTLHPLSRTPWRALRPAKGDLVSKTVSLQGDRHIDGCPGEHMDWCAGAEMRDSPSTLTTAPPRRLICWAPA